MKLHCIAATLTLALTTTLSLATGEHGSAHGHGTEANAIGQPGLAAKVSRTVEVGMTDAMRFNPATINVKRGETVRFKIKNLGKLKHEFILGTEKDLKEHYQVMLKNPEMEHDEPNMITLGAGKMGEVIWQFTKAGKVDFACLQPGHYDAGMKGAVKVGSKSAAMSHSHSDHRH